MRKIKLFLSLLMLIAFSVGNVWGAAYKHTFATTTQSISGDVCTVTVADGHPLSIIVEKNGASNFASYAPFRMYNKNKMTISANSGYVITQVDVEFSSAQNLTVTTDAVNYSYESYSFIPKDGEGNAASCSTVSFTNGNSSQARITSVTITYQASGSTPTCATPTFSPEAGSYEGTQNVTISSTTGATIYYTTDGTTPSTTSSVYSTPIAVSANMTIKAYAVKEGADDSEVASAAYTITEGPDVTINLLDEGWGFPTSKVINETSYTNGSYTIKVAGTSGNGFRTYGTYFLLGQSGAYIELPVFTSPIAKIVVAGNSNGSGTVAWNVFQGENAVSTAASGCKSDAYTFDIATANQKANVAHSIKVTSAANLQIKNIKIYFGEAAAVDAPTISGETPFVSTTTVTLACTTDGASIYYTTDGTDPSSSSTLYEDPFELNAGATVRAIAIKGSDASSIAAKEFEKVTSYTTLADIFAKAEEVGSTATDIYVTFGGWKVSAKTSNNVFLTDGTNGAVIYGSGHGFNVGDVLTGTAACKVQLYKGFAELTSLNSGTTGLTVTAGSVGDPVVKTWDQLSAVNTGALVKLENLTYDGSKLTDGNDNTIPTYTTFYTASFETGKSYNLVGVYQYYNTDGQILPRSAADVQEIIETFTVTYNNPDHGTLTIKNGDEVVTSGSAVNEGTVLTIVTNPAEDYKLVGVTVNGSAYTETTLELTEDVVIAAEFELNEAPLVTSYILSEIGVETSHLNGEHVGDKVNLPLAATECSKTFRGWSTNASCTVAPEYAPGAEITLAANNKFYAVYADANIVTPTDHALGSLTVGGTSGNTASEGYTYTSNKTNDKAGYTQDSGTKDADIVHLQIKAASQIINEEPSAIIVTAHLGAGADRDELTYPVNAVLVDAEGNNVGDPVVLTNSIPDKNGADFSANLPTANYADVRGVKISHMKEDGWNVRYYSMSFKYQTGGTTYDNYSTDCQAQVATPVIAGVSPSGVYTEAKEITITCATDGATIYYAVDSDEEPSTEYTGAFTVDTDGAHTVKAKAVKAGMAASEIASVSFTINLPLSTMDQIFAAATAAGNTATDVNITFGNWVVSGVSTNGKNVFVTDGTKGFIIFDNGGEMGFAVGDVLSGTAACKVQLYKGAAELTNLSSATDGLNIATGGSVAPEVKAISALSGINTGAPVTINSVQFDGEYLTDGVNSIKPFNTLFAYDDLTENSYYNITGIYQQFGDVKEILPRNAADIEEVSLSDPEISYTPASATIELGQSLPGTTFANPHELAISYSSNNESVATVTDEGVIALGTETGTAVITASFAGNGTYAAANVTYTITVNPASVSQNVVVLAEHNSKFYAMTTTITNETAVPVEVEYDGTKVTVAKDADKDAIQWTKKTIGENITFQTKDEDKLYLKGTSGGATLSLNATACNWAWDGTNNCYVTGTRGFIYRISTNGFKNYGVSNLSNADYVAPQVIVIDPANIVVTEKADAELVYTPAEVTLTVGGAFTPAVLSYAEGFNGLAAVTYASNNENVATVNESGVVSLVADATGTATITATFAGNNNYLAGSASYVITVNEAGDDLTGTWVLASSVAAGDKFIVAGTYNNETKTMGKQNTNPNRAAVASTVDEWDVLTPGEDTKVFTLVDAGNGKFAIQASNGKYLSATGTGTKNYLAEAEDFETDNAKWTISIENGLASVVASSNNRNELQYNKSGDGLFSCYDGNQTAIQIFKIGTPDYGSYQRNVTNGNYGTICLPQAGNITGATLFEIGSFENEIIYVDEVLSGELEAGKPYIFQATADQLNVTYTSGAIEETAGSANGLHGFYNLNDEDATQVVPMDDKSYILYENAYWLVKGRGAYIANYRAYIVLDDITPKAAAQGRRRVAMTVHSEQVATGMENVQGDNVQCTKVLIDGQLFILRGEKMYDVKGQLVK